MTDPRPDQDTDIIPGLRPSDTPPMPLDFPTAPGPRHRRRRDMPVVAQIALWGVPVGGLALIVGWTAPGLLGGDEARPAPPAVSSPSEEAGPVAVPSLTLPSPTLSRADRSRSRTATPSPSATSTTASPSPSPSRTSPSPSPEPSRSRSLTPPSPPPTSRTVNPPVLPPGDDTGDDDPGAGPGGPGSPGSDDGGPGPIPTDGGAS